MRKLCFGLTVLFAACMIYWGLSGRKPQVPQSEATFEPASARVVRSSLRLRPTSVPEERKTNQSVLSRILAGHQQLSVISPETLAAFLERSHTNAQSLITAFQITRDPSYLRLAATKFPEDAEVLFSVVAHDAFPENRREWLEKLKTAMPDNGIGNYLSAREHYKNGRPELALQEMAESRAKDRFYEFTPDKIQSLEDLYLAAGKPAAEAKALAMANVLLPHVQQLRDLSKDLKGAQAQLIAAGDYEAAWSLAISGAELGQHLSRGAGAKSLLNQIVGLVIEGESLAVLPPEHLDVADRFSSVDRREAIEREKERVREASKMFDQWSSTAEEAQIISYFDRVKLYGEPAALAWLANSFRP